MYEMGLMVYEPKPLSTYATHPPPAVQHDVFVCSVSFLFVYASLGIYVTRLIFPAVVPFCDGISLMHSSCVCSAAFVD